MSKLHDLILQTIGEEHSSTETGKPERLEEYRRLFADGALDLSKMSTKEASDRSITHYSRKIFEGNPWLEELRSTLKFRNVATKREATKSIRVSESDLLVVLDSHTQKFIWMMNKSHIYGFDGLTPQKNIELYVGIFLHFSSIALSGGAKAFPQPKTPPHPGTEGFSALAMYTEAQEIFLLCHEIAHELLQSQVHKNQFELIASSRNRIAQDIVDKHCSDSLVDEEIRADEIALEMTLNVYDRNSPEAVEFVMTSVYLVIRYFLWLRMIYKPSEEDYEFGMWLSRNSFFREKARQIYRWSSPDFLVGLSEYLEARMEPAALIAQKIIEDCKHHGEL